MKKLKLALALAFAPLAAGCQSMSPAIPRPTISSETATYGQRVEETCASLTREHGIACSDAQREDLYGLYAFMDALPQPGPHATSFQVRAFNEVFWDRYYRIFPAISPYPPGLEIEDRISHPASAQNHSARPLPRQQPRV